MLKKTDDSANFWMFLLSFYIIFWVKIMLKCEILKVFGFEPAIRGMRNPMNSWEKSDSHWEAQGKHYDDIRFVIGENDLNLMKKLFQGGTAHRKERTLPNVVRIKFNG